MNNDNTPKIYCLHYKECDPKKCTAIKLKRLNLVEIISQIRGKLKNAIVLNPFSQLELTIEDRAPILNYGLIVIDCSWKNILNLNTINSGIARRLPPLIAVNPTNYGKWEKLSSVEALAAALYITKFEDLAKLLLSKFSWGEQFWINNFKKNK